MLVVFDPSCVSWLDNFEMIVDEHGFAKVYESIIADTNTAEESRVILYVSTENCDSVCACRILQVIFHSQKTFFPLRGSFSRYVPCAGFSLHLIRL